MSSESLIIQYLTDTFPIRELIETFPPLNADEANVSQSVLAPWSIDSVSANTGVPVNEVIQIILELDGFNLLEVNRGTSDLTVAQTNRKPVVDGSGYKPARVNFMTVSRLMNLHILQFLESRVLGTNLPVKIEDAIFDLKNALFLPDDFMPEHLMGMVEGEPDFSEEEMRESYSIADSCRSIYFFQETKSGGFGRIRYLYPAASGKPINVPSNEKIRELISGSFNSIQENKSYLDFINSRLIKTVIFNIEQKNTRELKRPFFNPGKIKVLEDMGLVEWNGETPSIKSSVTLSSLKDIYSGSKAAGQKLAVDWLTSEVGVN